jgi:ketosteroid isomerase-like protein
MARGSFRAIASVGLMSDVDELTRIARESAQAYFDGDLDTYAGLVRHDHDFSLMPPFGGPTVHGFTLDDTSRESTRRTFHGGEVTVDVEAAYVGQDLAVLAVVERQHGQVGELPAQDWSLRVTLAFRREGDGWRLVHRHADALVHPIGWDTLAGLARG